MLDSAVGGGGGVSEVTKRSVQPDEERGLHRTDLPQVRWSKVVVFRKDNREKKNTLN